MIDFKHIWNNLHGNSTSKEDAILKSWLSKDSKNVEFSQRIKDYYEGRINNPTYTKDSIEKQWILLDKKLVKKPNKTRKLVAIASIAATLAVLIAGIYWIINNQTNIQKNTSFAELYSRNSHDILLVSSNGKEYNISESKPFFIEENGMVIEISDDHIRYTSNNNINQKNIIYHRLYIPDKKVFKIYLSDGSVMWLNGNSSTIYPVRFKKDIREITLSGEAYFEVKTDQMRPFEVKTGNMFTSVLGTSFNISNYEYDSVIYTTLIEGKVKVYYENQPEISEILNPEEQVLFLKHELGFEKKKVTTREFIAWKDGYFYFHDQTLQSIMNTLADWYTLDIVFTNDDLKKIRFSGEFKKYEDFKEVFKLIEKTYEFSYTIDGTSVEIK